MHKTVLSKTLKIVSTPNIMEKIYKMMIYIFFIIKCVLKMQVKIKIVFIRVLHCLNIVI